MKLGQRIFHHGIKEWVTVQSITMNRVIVLRENGRRGFYLPESLMPRTVKRREMRRLRLYLGAVEKLIRQGRLDCTRDGMFVVRHKKQATQFETLREALDSVIGSD